MIPILFESTATSFTTNGIGRLSDAISCTVTEERNGPYELEMQYPISGVHFHELQHSRIIYATPADGKDAQPFRIYRIEKPLDGICTIFRDGSKRQQLIYLGDNGIVRRIHLTFRCCKCRLVAAFKVFVIINGVIGTYRIIIFRLERFLD